MFAEVNKIIEGALKNDRKKVLNYTKLLIENLEKSGEKRVAKILQKTLQNQKGKLASTDELLTLPVDQESRMTILDVFYPTDSDLDIHLTSEVKDQIQKFIDEIKFKNELLKNGINKPSSLLLYVIPGVGKTTLAKYISKEIGLPLYIARFDAIVSSLLGNTSKNIRKIFDFADQKPCILMLDEFDAIAKARDDKHELGELKRVINSLLQNMDLFSTNNTLIAATNHPDLLDKAIWRRFSTIIEIKTPAYQAQLQMLKGKFKANQPDFLLDTKRGVYLETLLSGKTPSDLEKIVNNTVANMVIKGKSEIHYHDFILEVYMLTNHSMGNNEEMILFLHNNGITQQNVAEVLSISLRQVRNIIKSNNEK